MDIRKLQRVIVDGLEDVKAQNIVVFNTEHLSPLFERVIIASGTSNRQTRSLAASVRDAVKSAGDPAPRTEGEDNGEWIIVDCGAAVVARHAAGDPRLLPPRRDLGRQAGADEDRRRAAPRLVKAGGAATATHGAAKAGAARQAPRAHGQRRAGKTAPAAAREAAAPRSGHGAARRRRKRRRPRTGVKAGAKTARRRDARRRRRRRRRKR